MNRLEQQHKLIALLDLPHITVEARRDRSQYPDYLLVRYAGSPLHITLRGLYRDCVEICFMSNGRTYSIKHIGTIEGVTKLVRSYDQNTGNIVFQHTEHERDEILAGVLELLLRKATNTLVSWPDYNKVQVVDYISTQNAFWVFRDDNEIILHRAPKVAKIPLNDPNLERICLEFLSA